jgi:acetyl-CoA synthetase
MRDIKVKGKSMHWKPIKKSCDTWILQPNLLDYDKTCANLDYDKTCANFSWEAIRRELDGLPGGKGLNIAYEAIDRHAIGPRCNYLAIRWLGKDRTVLDFTYGELKEQSNRFANMLRQLGVGKGDRVFVLTGRIPALYIAALGTFKNMSVFCPLFSGFGPSSISS